MTAKSGIGQLDKTGVLCVTPSIYASQTHDQKMAVVARDRLRFGAIEMSDYAGLPARRTPPPPAERITWQELRTQYGL